MPRSTVLILGAAGRFGAAAMQAFAAAGWRVLAQQRRAPLSPLPAAVERVDIPLEQPHALAVRAAGAQTVVYAVNPPYTRWGTDLMPLFHQGLAVAEQLRARFMIPGNVYNYGQGMPPLLSPQTVQRPTTPKGELRLAMEVELGERASRGLDSVMIRAGDFYGAGSGGWFDEVIVRSIAAGKLVYPGPLDTAHAWAYVPDLARAFVAAAGTTQGGFVPLHFAGNTLTGRELLAAIEAAALPLGLRPEGGFRVGSLPWPLLRLAGLVHPMSREIVRMSYLWRVPHALDGSALERHLGAAPAATPLVAALRASLLALRPQPAVSQAPAAAR